MPFERHVFISYAHLDNEPLPTEKEKKEGWVSLLHATLTQFLESWLGASPDIWRDARLAGNDDFSKEILAQFRKTAVLVSVLTPRYLKSEWCTKELEHFCDSAERTGGLMVGNKSRVFKISKVPTGSPEALPPVLTKVLGYDFYELDDNKTPREFDPVYGDKSKQDFLRTVARLAWDIKLLLERLNEPSTAARAATVPAKPVVYLAECSYDRRDAREILAGELTRLGYTVLPDEPLPRDEAEYLAAVERLLRRSHLSIHLVGESYGAVPDGPSQKSVVLLQNDRAVKRSRDGGLLRIIWLPDGTRSDQAAQQAFIDALHADAETQRGADLITGDLEKLKGAVHATLTKLEHVSPPAAAAPETAGARKRVHVLYDARDPKDAIPLLRALAARVDVTRPLFSGDAAAVRAANHALLMDADAVILYYGGGDDAWKFHQQKELTRIRALRIDRPLPRETVYVAPAPTDDKEVLVGLGGADVIDALNGFPEARVRALLDTIVSGGQPS